MNALGGLGLRRRAIAWVAEFNKQREVVALVLGQVQDGSEIGGILDARCGGAHVHLNTSGQGYRGKDATRDDGLYPTQDRRAGIPGRRDHP